MFYTIFQSFFLLSVVCMWKTFFIFTYVCKPSISNLYWLKKKKKELTVSKEPMVYHLHVNSPSFLPLIPSKSLCKIKSISSLWGCKLSGLIFGRVIHCLRIHKISYCKDSLITKIGYSLWEPYSAVSFTRLWFNY